MWAIIKNDVEVVMQCDKMIFILNMCRKLQNADRNNAYQVTKIK